MALIPPNFGAAAPASEEDRRRQRMAQLLMGGGTGQSRNPLEAFGNAFQSGVGQMLQNRQPQMGVNSFPSAPGASPISQVGQNIRNAFGMNNPGNKTPW
jgi:hypothetical protein